MQFDFFHPFGRQKLMLDEKMNLVVLLLFCFCALFFIHSLTIDSVDFLSVVSRRKDNFLKVKTAMNVVVSE